MTDSEGANTQRPDGEDEQIVPASGGTFGVTDDRSDFGRGPISPRATTAGTEAEASEDDGALDVDGLTNDYTERVKHPEHREYGDYAGAASGSAAGPASGGQDVPGQAGQIPAGPGAQGQAGQAPRDQAGSGVQGQAVPGQDGRAGGAGQQVPTHGGLNGQQQVPPAQGYGAPPAQQQGDGQPREREFAPTQFGAPAATATAAKPTLSFVGLGLAILALILLCFPGFAWIVAGVVAVAGLVVAVVAMSREPKGKAFAGIGIAASAIAIALVIATAIVVAL